MERSFKRRDKVTRQGESTTLASRHHAQWLDNITHTKYGAVTGTERTLLEVELQVNGKTHPQKLPVSPLSVYRGDENWRLRDAGQQVIEDEQLLAALDGGPSFELWPSGNLRVGRRWCFSGDEIERRLGPLGIDYGSLNLVVERIGREPATGLQTAYLKGSLHAVLPHRGVDTLLKARVSADVSLRLGMALRLDINGRYQGKSLEPIIRGLLRSGADPDKASASGETPLMLAMKRILDQTELVRLLLEAGADPGKRDGRGNTLLQAGADVHARNSFQETPLLSAAAKGRVEVMD